LVRSTQATGASESGHWVTSVAAIRSATSRVVGPGVPSWGSIPIRVWNATIVRQSSTDCLPSATTRPYVPILSRAASTSAWNSPGGQGGSPDSTGTPSAGTVGVGSGVGVGATVGAGVAVTAIDCSRGWAALCAQPDRTSNRPAATAARTRRLRKKGSPEIQRARTLARHPGGL
jgi:hypothetical protein